MTEETLCCPDCGSAYAPPEKDAMGQPRFTPLGSGARRVVFIWHVCARCGRRFKRRLPAAAAAAIYGIPGMEVET